MSIGFDLNMLNQYCEEKGIYNSIIEECEYNYNKIISKLITYWDKEYKNFQVSENSNEVGFSDGNLFSYISKLCFKAKSKEYLVENEWRLCKNEHNENNVKFKVKGNLIVPFIEHYFDKSIIKKIIIGPSINSEQVEKSLKFFLRKFNYSNAQEFLERSNISYRLI